MCIRKERLGKLENNFKGPYVIDTVLPNYRYLIKDPENFQHGIRPFSGIFDSSNLKKWMSLNNSDKFDENEMSNKEIK